MPTQSDYLNLSNAVYTTGGATPVAPSGWTLVDFQSIAEDGFQAAAFKNNTTGQIVITYEGTNLSNLGGSNESYLDGQLAADAAIASGQTPDANPDALAFAQRVAAANGGSALYLDGHSLGGEEAEFVQAAVDSGQAGSLTIAGGVAFGAPGVPNQTADTNSNFTTYIDSGDIVGNDVPSGGSHVGTVIYVGNAGDAQEELDLVNDGSGSGALVLGLDDHVLSHYASDLGVTLSSSSQNPLSSGSADVTEITDVEGAPSGNGTPEDVNGSLEVNGATLTVATGSEMLSFGNGSADLLINPTGTPLPASSEFQLFSGPDGTGTNFENILNLSSPSGSPATNSWVEKFTDLPVGTSEQLNQYSGFDGTDTLNNTTYYGINGTFQVDDFAGLPSNSKQITLDFNSGSSGVTASAADILYTNDTQVSAIINQNPGTLGSDWYQITNDFNAAGQQTQSTVTDNNGYYQITYDDQYGDPMYTDDYTNDGVFIQQVDAGTTDDAGFDFTNSGILNNLDIGNDAQSSLSQTSDTTATLAAEQALLQAYAVANAGGAGSGSYTPVFDGGKWSSNVITWSLANNPGTTAAPFSSYMSSQYASLVTAAFQQWASVSGLTFEEVSDSTSADIRVGWGDFDTANSGVVGYTSYQINAGSMQPNVIVRLEDPSQDALTTDANGNLVYSGTTATLYQSILHEIGHALGLADNFDPNSIMSFESTTSNPVLDTTDSAGMQQLYSRLVTTKSFGTSGGQTLTGGSGYTIYDFAAGDGADTIVNGVSTNSGPTGELDFGSGITGSSLSFSEMGSDLVIGVTGSADQVTVQGWFANGYSELETIKAGDGTIFTADGSNLISEDYAAGTSQLELFDPSNGVSTEVEDFSGLDGTGSLTSAVYNWSAGGSQVQSFAGLPAGVSEEIKNYTGANGSGTLTEEIFDYSAGNSQAELFNPSNGISSEFQNFSGPNATGTLTSAVYDWSAGGSQVQTFNPSDNLSEVVKNFDGADGTGNLLSAIYDWSAGGSQMQTFNPSDNLSEVVKNFDGADGTGNLLSAIYDWSAGGSQVQTFNPSDDLAEVIKNFTGADGTGTLTSAVYDWSAGGSQVQTFNPSDNLSEVIDNFTGANGTGTLTSAVYNWSAGGSQMQSFNPSSNLSEVITNYTGANATGSLISTTLIGTSGNDTLTASSSGNVTLEGNGGYDTYQFGIGDGTDIIVNGLSTNTGPTGELDFGAGISTNQIWLQQSGNDLQLDIMGTHDQITISNWFGSSTAQLQEIKTADGSELDSQVAQLVQAMANYSAANPGFDPTAVSQVPNDPTLQNALASAWHH